MSRSAALYLVVLITVSAGAGATVWYATAPPVDSISSDSTQPLPAIPKELLTPPSKPKTDSGPALPAGVEINFVNVTAAAGISFVHFDGQTPKDYIMETTGAGLGWLDYDGDGLMDLFFVQGSTLQPPVPTPAPLCRLYRNLGNGKFRDVTAEVGLDKHFGFCQGCAVGDIDNDGFPELFITCFGKPNVLLKNEPDGKGGRRFQDITQQAGLGSHPDWKDRPNYSTSAAFLDYNNDGKLDLFVCSYVKIDLANYPDCHTAKGTPASCPPKRFHGTRCVLYRNNGDGTFTDVSKAAGIDQPNAKALGVVALDLDDDGLIDIFVANDGEPNFLFRNRGDGTFEALGPASGAAVNLSGQPQAYMGVDADDLTGDGRPDIFSTAFARETNTLFRNDGKCQFFDMTQSSGLGPPSWYRLGFGTCLLDVDRDGSLDIVVANGHVFRGVDEEGDPNNTYRQPAQLFLGDGKGRFRELSKRAGAYFQEAHVGRGLAPCDYDNDGHMDLAFSNRNSAPALLHNESKTPYHWVRLELRGTKSNRDAIGAKVTIHLGDRKIVRHRKGGGSYLSAGDPRLLIGVGAAAKMDRVEVRWPAGQVQSFGPLDVDRGYLLVEGDDKVTPRP